MNKKLTIFVMLIFPAITIFSQSKTPPQSEEARKAETQRLVKLSQKLEGTYQVQIIDSRESATLPLSVMDTIEAKRQPSQTVYFWLKNNTRVMVPPVSVISKNDFVPLARVTHISSKELNK